MKIKIGENLRKLRIKNELTQEQLAEIFGNFITFFDLFVTLTIS